MYYVVGGEYTGTDFKTIVEGKDEEYGPFDNIEEAEATWHKYSWMNVDDCMYRYIIEERNE